MYDLTRGARWTLVPTPSSFRPGGTIEIDDEHEHERMIYIVDGTFELVFPGEAPTRLRSGEGASFHSVGRYRITNVGRGRGRVLAGRFLGVGALQCSVARAGVWSSYRLLPTGRLR